MDVALRPLSLGEVLDRTFQLYRSHFLMFAGISTFAAGLDLIWKLIQAVCVHAVQNRIGAVALGGINSGFALINAIVAVIVAAVAMAAISRAVSAIYLGKPTGIAQAYGEIKAHWLRYVWLYIVAAFMAWGPVLLAFVAIIAIAFAIPGFNSGTLGVGIGIAVLFLSMLALVPFGIWMTLRYSLANPACVFEDLRVSASLKRSVYLTKGAAQKTNIFVLLFLVWVVASIITYAGLTPVIFMVFQAVSRRGVPAISLGITIYTLVIGFIVSAVTIPLYSIGLTLFYYDARIRKEGFDVEWLIQRAASDVMPPASVLPPAESTGQA